MLDTIMLALTLLAQTADPLAPAREGKLECVTPNPATKTCMAMSSYAAQPDGSWKTTTTVMIAPAPLTTMETTTVLRAEGDAVCGTVLEADFKAAKFVSGGTPLTAEQAAPISSQLLAAIAPLVGKKACSRMVPDGEAIKTEATLDGAPAPYLNQRLIWVKPSDGYRVGQ